MPSGKLFAVKAISIESEVDQKLLEYFTDELEKYMNFDHPNILEPLYFEFKHEQCLVFTELLSGGSLRTLLDSYGQFDESII